ncbi:MAG TPA: hypothetical protein VEQ58_12325 [Polyangiaceae bacterium]|nr:hypothetical protein [Polyangiaceae bacterium]
MEFYGAKGLLVSSLLLGCAAASPPAARKMPLTAQPAALSDACARAREVEASADAALRAGSLLRARRLGERTEQLCRSAPQALARAREALAAATGDPSALLSAGSAARGKGDLEAARRSESLAVALLERQEHAALSVVQRWSAKSDYKLDSNRYLATALDGQLQVMDAQTGKLVSRVAVPPQLSDLAVNATGDRLLLRSIDLSVVGQPAPACASVVNFYDTKSSKWLKHECAMSWKFTPDGSRLVVPRIVGWGDGAIMQVVVLDSQTLEPILTLPELGNVVDLDITPDGGTLAVHWSNRTSLTDLRAGTTQSFGAPGELISNVALSTEVIAWRQGGTLSLWNRGSRTLSSFELGACDQQLYRGIALSPSGARVAVECGDVATIWELATVAGRRPVKGPSVKAPRGTQLFSVQWLSGERGLVVNLVRFSQAETALYDTKLRRWLPLAGPGERVKSVDAASRLVIVSPERGPADTARVVHLDESLSLRAVDMPSCAAGEIVNIDGASALISCSSSAGPLAVVADTRTLATRSFPTSSCAPRVSGSTLVSQCYQELELRDLRTGALSAVSPSLPTPTAFDGWWDGDAFVSRVSLEDRDVLRVRTFGASLQSRTEAAPAKDDCGEHRGRAAWSSAPPYSICDRRSGAVTGHIPAQALGAEPYFRLQLSDDGKLVVAEVETSAVVRVTDGRAVPLAEQPHGLSFAGPQLLTGFTMNHDWGFWSGVTGQRLSRSNEQLGELPFLADAALGVAIELGRTPTIRDFATGKQLESLDIDRRGDVELTPRGVLSVVEPSRVAFFKVPQARRLGVLLDEPKSGEAAFLTDARGFELSGDPAHFRELLRCQVGLQELPFEICVDALLQPGLAAESLGEP